MTGEQFPKHFGNALKIKTWILYTEESAWIKLSLYLLNPDSESRNKYLFKNAYREAILWQQTNNNKKPFSAKCA